MKIHIDLLPPHRKKEIKKRELFLKVLEDELLFIVPSIVLIAMLISIYYILTLQKNVILDAYNAQKSQKEYQQLEVYQGKFKQTNLLVQNINKIHSKHLYWLNFFNQFSKILPEDVYVTDISTKDFNVFLVGKAKNRDNLLDLKSKLEAEPCFKNINVPISNLVVKEDVDFQIDISINEDCLKKDR